MTASHHSRLRIYTTVILIAVAAIDVMLALLPVPAAVADAGNFHKQLLVVSSFSLNYLAAAVLFLYGLRGFKPEMARSYRIITAGVAYFGLANLQYPWLLYAGLIPEPWSTHGGAIAVVVPGLLLHYAGVRHFANTLGIKSRFSSWPLLALSFVVLAAVSIMAPHAREMPEVWYGVHQAGAAAHLVINLFMAGLIISSLKVAGESYVAALRWMLAGVSVAVLGFAQVIVAAFYGQNTPYTLQGFTALPFILVALIYIAAGYQFCKIRLYGLDIKHLTRPGRAILDAVITAASLVSNRSDIKGEVEAVSLITARLTGGEALSDADQRKLAKIYLEIEDYLINHERLRTFTRYDLRRRLSDQAIRVLATTGRNH